MKKLDGIIIAICTILSMSSWLIIPNIFKSDLMGNTVLIKVDSREYKKLSLDQNQEFEIKTKFGKNKIKIQDKNVTMISADCKDGVCLDYKPIKNDGEIIVCLPHRVTIEIISQNNQVEDTIDGFSN